MEEKRKTGIEIVGDVLWGTHFCQFYQNKEDLIDILIPYFNTGLKNNEFCMWVTSEPLDEEEVKKAMRKVLPDFDQYLRKGQIEIIPYTKWYLEGGTFDAQRVLHSWVDKLNQALAKGFDGLRLTGNTFWLEKKDWRKFTDYEEEVNNVTGKHRMIALCTYSLDKCEANEVIDVVSNHQFALIKQEGKWNLIESSEHKRTEETLRKAYDELEKRIQERTEELLKINKELQVKITDRKRAEEKLKAASLYARSLIEASIDPLVTISADGKVMDVNRATELVTGVLREQLIGSDFSDYFTEPEKAKEGYKKVFSEGSVRDYPLAIRHSSCHITEVLYSATVYRNEAGEVQGVFAAARDITDRKMAEKALQESESRLRHLSSQLLTVQENERKRISREIHDSIGQTLAAIKFGLENKLNQIGKGPAPPGVSLESIISLAQNGIEESRRIQMDLRPSILDDLGILATIGWFTREFQKVYSQISVEKETNIEEKDVPNPLKIVIFRIIQEAMNNISKHSRATLIQLSLGKRGDKIELMIEDNGMGFDLETSKRGLGLTSMRERTELSGGAFVIESTPGKGTIIHASWPT